MLGTEYSGYKVGIFEAGTSTQKTTYKDSSLTAGNENTHPVTLDANGAAQIWFSGNAKSILYTSADVVVYTDDNINLESTSTATGASNLILNASFEDDTDGDGIPDNWTRTLYSAGTFTIDTTTQFNGSDSIKFTSAGTGGGYISSTSNFTVSPSVIYTVGFALKSSVADVRNVVEILWYKYDGTASATASTTVYDDSTTNPTSWTQKWYEATSPSDAAFAKFRLTGCHSSDATAGSTWFDNVTLTEYFLKHAHNSLDNSIWFAEGANVASASDCNIWTTDGNTVHLTGTVTVTDWGTAIQAGAFKWVICDAATPLTYNATTNDMNTNGDSYTAVAGDVLFVYARSTSSYKVTIYKYSDPGGRTLIQTQIASASATIDFTTGIDSTYDEYHVSIIDLVPATDDTHLYVRVSEDSGSTWKSGASDYYSNATAAAQMNLMQGAAAGNGISNVASEGGFSGTIKFYSPDATQNKLFLFEGLYLYATGGQPTTAVGSRGAYVLTTNAINGIRFLMSSGNITSGTFNLYGIRK